MEQEIVEYFESNGFHIHKLVKKNPEKLPEDIIFLAIHDIYNEIGEGRNIRRIELAREVWRKAYNYRDKDLTMKLRVIHANLKVFSVWSRIKIWVANLLKGRK